MIAASRRVATPELRCHRTRGAVSSLIRLPPRLVLAVLLAGVVLPRVAAAHFILQSPASWREQGKFGDPQKTGPCGDDDDAAAPTGIVTAFAPGETMTITIDEAIYHPGHYRVALAVSDRSELPSPPAVLEGEYSDCGSTDVQDPPLFPILADGMLVHDSEFSGPMSFQVTLPSDVTCTKCTLQVIEFMSSHGAPCFYHHCADISIQADAPTDCTTDGSCEDGNVCTANTCDTAAGACQSVDVSASCDDGDACTRDACDPIEACVATPISLAEASAGFLGSTNVPACANDDVPPAVGKLFQQADASVARAATAGAKATKLLNRARKRLRAAATKLGKASSKRVSDACRRALGDVVERARADVDCLRSSS